MTTPRTALRALRTTTSSLQQPTTRHLSTQTFSSLNRTIARSELSTPFNAIRTAFRTQTRKQTASAGTSGAKVEESGFGRFWNSNVGPKTVHFWAPIAKWGVVIAGLSDLLRDPATLSLQQNLALMATGAIWTRWCFVIKPRNIFLATVNFFLFCNGTMQVTRVLMWRSSQNADSVTSELGKAAKEEGQILKSAVEHPGKTVETAETRAKAGK